MGYEAVIENDACTCMLFNNSLFPVYSDDGWLHAMNDQGDKGLVPGTYLRVRGQVI